MDQQQNDNRLADVLREGVGVVEMVLYSCLRSQLSAEDSTRDSTEVALLAGAVTGEVFGSLNPEKKFVQFRSRHHAEIEQLLLSLATTLPELCPHLTDALRVQVLCDHQQGEDSSHLLVKAKNSGWLDEQRQTPLPSSFMTSVRELGAAFGLVIPPVAISEDEEKGLLN